MAPAVAAVLSEYPIEIIDFVTDPRTGLPSSQNYAATVKEVREACDARYQPVLDAARRERMLQQQMDERQRFLDELNAPKPTIAEMKAKYGENWGLTPREERKTNYRPLTEEELRQHYRKHDLGREPKKGEAA
jgi:hypothetical protein